jgi:hypothetical protein
MHTVTGTGVPVPDHPYTLSDFFEFIVNTFEILDPLKILKIKEELKQLVINTHFSTWTDCTQDRRTAALKPP